MSNEVETLTPAQMILAKLDALVGDVALLRQDISAMKDASEDTADTVDEIQDTLELLIGADQDHETFEG